MIWEHPNNNGDGGGGGGEEEKEKKKKTTEWGVQLFSGDTLAAVPLCNVWVPPASTFRFFFFFTAVHDYACMHACIGEQKRVKPHSLVCLKGGKEKNLTCSYVCPFRLYYYRMIIIMLKALWMLWKK